MKTCYDLYKDTTELRKALDEAIWEFDWEVWGELQYSTEIDGKEYHKVIHPDSTVLITDDLAKALGEVEEW